MVALQTHVLNACHDVMSLSQQSREVEVGRSLRLASQPVGLVRYSVSKDKMRIKDDLHTCQHTNTHTRTKTHTLNDSL